MLARENPFVTDRVLKIRYHFENDSWDALLARLAMLANRAAIVGPQGSGKTTLLEDLGHRLTANGYRTRSIRPRRDKRVGLSIHRQLGHVTENDIVLLDSSEQLGPVAWRMLRWYTRRAAGLIVTAHKPGRLPTLIRCTTTPALLRGFVEELIGVDHGLSDEQIRSLHAKHGGNIRESLRDLYDMFAELPAWEGLRKKGD